MPIFIFIASNSKNGTNHALKTASELF